MHSAFSRRTVSAVVGGFVALLSVSVSGCSNEEAHVLKRPVSVVEGHCVPKKEGVLYPCCRLFTGQCDLVLTGQDYKRAYAIYEGIREAARKGEATETDNIRGISLEPDVQFFFNREVPGQAPDKSILVETLHVYLAAGSPRPQLRVSVNSKTELLLDEPWWGRFNEFLKSVGCSDE